MRKHFLLITTGVFWICTTALAGTYNIDKFGNRHPQHSPKKEQSYNTSCCTWPDSPAVKSAIKQLKNYHVTSVIYPDSLRFVIPDYILFEPLSNQFVGSAKPTMNIILALLQHLPKTKIKVTGYSDNIAQPSISKRRSLLNAQKIAGVFWSNGYPAYSQTLGYQGKGETNPIDSNESIDTLMKNNRVEITLNFPKGNCG